MPSTDRRLRAAVASIAVGVLAGCVADPSPTSPPGTDEPSAAPSESHASPRATPSASATPGFAIEPGRPYDAPAILEAMRTSRRPGGVPDELETEAIAAAVSQVIYTLDGTPWPSMAIGGSCGPSTCTLELAGTPQAALGEDLYVLSVAPASSGVEVLETNLRGMTPEIAEHLDARARAAWEGNLEGLVLASARWQPPPDSSRFLLSYRSGGEEGSPGVELILDLDTGRAEEG